MTTKIECLIRRAGGSRVQMDGPKREYHFKPSADDQRHIASVDVDVHVKQLLRIKEGYRAVDDESLSEDTLDDDPTGRQLKGSTIHNASYTIKGGDEIALEDLVNMAFDDSGLDEQTWNDLSDHERYEYINTTLSELQDGEQAKDAPIIESVGEPVNATAQQAEVDEDTPAADPQDDEQDHGEQAKDADGNGVNDDLEDLTGKELIPLYEAKFGRKPSRQMKIDDIRRALSEDDD